MEKPIKSTRESKYCNAIRLAIKKLGHPTNAQIASQLRKTFPSVSDTTVHRATARLASRGEIGVAPQNINGDKRYDANANLHDHYMCLKCGKLQDLPVIKEIKEAVNELLDECSVNGPLNITGECSSCH